METFTIFKLRSMKMDAEKEGPQWLHRKIKELLIIKKSLERPDLMNYLNCFGKEKLIEK